MNDLIVFVLLVAVVIGLAKFVNIFIPPDYHQRIEDKYNEIDE